WPLTNNPVHVIRNFFLNIPRFSLNEDISFKASGALVSSSDNFNVEGLVKINPNKEEVVLKNMTFKFNPETLSLLDIGLLTGSADSLKDIRGIKGDVQVDVQQCRVGADGLIELLVSGQWVRGQIDTIDPMPVNQIDMRFTATEKTFELKSVDVQLESGVVKAQGRVENYLENPVISFKAGAEDMDLAVLLKDQEMPAKVEGKLFVSAEGSIADVKSAEALDHLVVKGRLDVQEGEIKDVNLLGLVISKIPFVPSEILGVGERYLLSYLQKELPEKYREDIQRQHTTIEKLTSQFVVKDGFLTLSETEMKTPQLSLTTDVVVDFSQNLTFKGDAFISPELSNAMIKSVEQFQALLDEQGRIHLPLKSYQGSLKNFKTYPNIQNFGKGVIKNELKNAIFDAIGVEKESPSGGGDPASEGEAQPKKPAKKPEEVLIENVLDAIFK
ncbi:MAG: hypothetical protein KC618_08430, partial [Candidatus Omnitrophica bacterium]|nr:hypothetical protein [Candidatus Omnitrophota bacterium]